MNITMIDNSSQSLCSIAITGANLFLAELKKCVMKKGVYNAVAGGKIFHLCKHLLDQNVVLGILRGGGGS